MGGRAPIRGAKVGRIASISIVAIAACAIWIPPLAVAQSRAKPLHQSISDTQLRKARDGAVRALFAVTYPDVGRPSSTASVRLTVFSGPRRGTPIASFDRKLPRRRAGKIFSSVTIRGRAAHRLRRSGLNRLRTLKMVLITSRDERQLDSDRFPDFNQMVTRPLSAAPRIAPVGGVPAGSSQQVGPGSNQQLGTAAVSLKVVNHSSKAVHVTAAPLGCLYDGASNSYISAFNENLSPGEPVSARVERDANSRQAFQSGFALAPGSSWGGGTVITPGLADALYNPSVKGLLFAVLNQYTSDEADPQIFSSALNQLPSRSDKTCALTDGGHFVIGADRFMTTSGGGPTDARSAAIFQITGDGKIKQTASLANTPQLVVKQNGNEEIDIVDGPAPTCPNMTIWLRCQLPADDQVNKNVRLVDLAIPGSHDAGSASLASNDNWFFKQGGSCSSWTKVYDDSPGRVYNAGATQTLTIPDQLAAGIRYLDLRMAYDSGSGSGKMSDPGRKWRLLHSMFAQGSARAEMQDVANWARAHPSEVVIADLNHTCYDHSSSLTEQQQYQQLFTDMATPDPVTGVSLCDVAYQLPSGVDPDNLPSQILDQVRGTGRNVIAVIDDTGGVAAQNGCGIYHYHDATVDTGAVPADEVPLNHLWPNDTGPNVCSAAAPSENAPAASRIGDFPYRSGGDYTPDKFGDAPDLNHYLSASPPPFTQTQTQYTADTYTVIFGVILGCGSLENYEMPAITHYRAQILNAWGIHMNIAIGDFVTADDFIPRIIGYGPG
jgi:hypothetical protein